MLISDASSEDWATIGVKVLSVALVPQGGGGNVTVYTAPSPAPTVNLVQLDQLAEILGNVSVPVGTYTGAVITVSGNAGDILLTTAADPESGFAAAGGVTIPAGQIQVQHTQGSAGSLTVPIDVTLATPLVVSTTQSNALDLEFDLGHPAFIVAHVPPGSGGTIWSVNFSGPVHHHPLRDLPRLVLRHTYGSVTGVSTDDSSITITKEFPTEPAVSPETAVASTQSLQILADATNGTLFYDMDAKSTAVVKDFSAQAMTLVGKSVRIAARYQADGTLVATRIWASSNFSSVWLSPEGHVLHVNPTSNTVTVANESGIGVPLRIDANTQFFFRQPQDGLADATPIATGTALLASHGLARGFKVHASVVDPLATPLVAQTIDIETAVYDGAISAASATGFTYTRKFFTASDDYVEALPYISANTPNGEDASGNAITGFKWWNFAYPTLLMSGYRCGHELRRSDQRQCRLRRSRGRSALAWRELRSMERSCQRERLGDVGHRPHTLHPAARIRGFRTGQRQLHDDGVGRSLRGHGQCGHGRGLRNARLSGRPHQQHRNGEFDRRDDECGHHFADQRTRRRCARQGLRGAAGGRDLEGLRVDLLHGRYARPVASASSLRCPSAVRLHPELHGAFSCRLVGSTPIPKRYTFWPPRYPVRSRDSVAAHSRIENNHDGRESWADPTQRHNAAENTKTPVTTADLKCSETA